ncbi:unnamed protein product [Musa hybrid cultivar]
MASCSGNTTDRVGWNGPFDSGISRRQKLTNKESFLLILYVFMLLEIHQ